MLIEHKHLYLSTSGCRCIWLFLGCWCSCQLHCIFLGSQLQFTVFF